MTHTTPTRRPLAVQIERTDADTYLATCHNCTRLYEAAPVALALLNPDTLAPLGYVCPYCVSAEVLDAYLAALRAEYAAPDLILPTVLLDRDATRAETDAPALSIKWNNTATNDPCAICGARTDPALGPELFLSDSWSLVCWDCGRKYAPELVQSLEAQRPPGDLDQDVWSGLDL